MIDGKVRVALRLIAADDRTGRLLCLEDILNQDNPSETVRDILLKKHPRKQPNKEASLVNPNTPVTDPHPIIFERIDSQLIRSTVLKMNGAAGPLSLDTSAWK